MIASPLHLYQKFRFRLAAQAPGAEPLPVMAVWSDVFQRDRIWVAAAHVAERDTLEAYFRAAKGSPVTVTMYDREDANPRAISFTFKDLEWLPFDLHAQEEDHAVEHIVLSGVEFVGAPR